MRHLVASLLIATAAVACAGPSAQTIPPGHGSITAEENAAREHERTAGLLERQGMNEGVGPVRCGPPVAGATGQICWSSAVPTGAGSYGMMKAAEQREAAAEHRRVSQALRDAELRACAGIAEADVNVSPFAHKDDIIGVQVLQAIQPDGSRVPLGAQIRFHELRQLSADWFQHVIDCHVARDNALGHDVPEMSYCPLVPRGATATVSAVPHGFMVDIRSDDPQGAAEIARRAQALVQ